MPQNNFQELFEEEDQETREKFGANLSNVQGQIWQSLSLFRFIGDIVDVYVPRLIETVIYVAGGNPENNSNRNDPASGSSTPPPGGPIADNPVNRNK